MSVYTDEGFKNRRDYLNDLADEHEGVSRDTVYMLADLLGADEEFDGLVTAIEDAEWQAEHDARGGGLYMGRFSEGSISGRIAD